MIEVEHLGKSYPGQRGGPRALDGISITVAPGSLHTLLGPSGCGKTTLLRCIAGLERPDSGTIRVNGTVVFSAADGIDVPTNRRRVGMVFQSYAIWPHMTVFDNVAFPLATRRVADARARTEAALDAVGLERFGGRSAARLSGGQQQRVALARAIVAEPATLLLDEPLSNLDAGLREQMRDLIREVQQRLGLTTVLVTHDQDEALSMSDHITLLRAGSVVEHGMPRSLFTAPATAFGAAFIGAANVLPGMVGVAEGGLTPIDCDMGRIWTEAQATPGRAWAVIRPDRVQVAASDGRQPNRFHAVVKSRKFLGEHVALGLEIRHGDRCVTLKGRCSDMDVPNVCTVFIDPGDVGIAS